MLPRSGQRSPDPDRLRAQLVPLDGTAPADLDRDQTSIGSAADNQLVLAATTVSRHHALLARNGREYRIVDLASTNGTWVNGRRIDGSAVVRPGDEIRFGSARFVLRNPPDTLAMPTPARRFSPLVLSAIIAIFFAASFGLADFLLNFSRLDQAATGTAAASPASAVPWEEPVAGPSEKPAATPASDETSSPEVLAWLAPLNRYRAMAGLAAVTADPDLSRGDYLHSRYLVKNYADDIRKGVDLGLRMHTEDRGNRWYTEDGLAAAGESDIEEGFGDKPVAPDVPINGWMGGPFHRVWLLNPKLRSAGYGQYCESHVCVRALDLGGHDANVLTPRGFFPKPIEFPPDGSKLNLPAVRGEWPSPLTGCAGYVKPVGLPITIQTGFEVDPKLSAATLTRGGAPLETCAFDAASYVNPAPADQDRARNILSGFGTIVLIPRAPLTPGTYSVSISTAARTYAWSFTITP